MLLHTSKPKWPCRDCVEATLIGQKLRNKSAVPLTRFWNYGCRGAQIWKWYVEDGAHQRNSEGTWEGETERVSKRECVCAYEQEYLWARVWRSSKDSRWEWKGKRASESVSEREREQDRESGRASKRVKSQSKTHSERAASTRAQATVLEELIIEIESERELGHKSEGERELKNWRQTGKSS